IFYQVASTADFVGYNDGKPEVHSLINDNTPCLVKLGGEHENIRDRICLFDFSLVHEAGQHNIANPFSSDFVTDGALLFSGSDHQERAAAPLSNSAEGFQQECGLFLWYQTGRHENDRACIGTDAK